MVLGIRRQPGRIGPRADDFRPRPFGPDRRAVRRLAARSRSATSRSRGSPICPVVGRSCSSARIPSSTHPSLLTSLVALYLVRTRAGLTLRSVGENHASAHALGLPVLQDTAFSPSCSAAPARASRAPICRSSIPASGRPGMTAGRGWIALALVVFAAWRPGWALVGAYIFGAATVLQLHAQAAQFGVPSQAPVGGAVSGDDPGPSPPLDPAWPGHRRSGFARRAICAGSLSISAKGGFAGRARTCNECRDPKQGAVMSTLKILGALAGAVALALTAGGAAAQQQKLKVGFIYVGPGGRPSAGATSTTVGRQAIEKALGDKVETTFVESVPEADSERAIEQLARTGHGLVFTTSFGFMEPTLKVASKYPEREVRACDRLQARAQPRDLCGEVPRGPLHHRPDRRQDVEVRHHRLCRRLPDPGSRRRHQLVFPRRPVGEPEHQDQGRLGELLVRSGQGSRRRQGAARPGRRRLAQHTDSPAPLQTAGGARQARLRPGLRHGALRAQGAAHRHHRQLVGLLRRADQGGARRHLEIRGHLGRPEGPAWSSWRPTRTCPTT